MFRLLACRPAGRVFESPSPVCDVGALMERRTGIMNATREDNHAVRRDLKGATVRRTLPRSQRRRGSFLLVTGAILIRAMLA